MVNGEFFKNIFDYFFTLFNCRWLYVSNLAYMILLKYFGIKAV